MLKLPRESAAVQRQESECAQTAEQQQKRTRLRRLLGDACGNDQAIVRTVIRSDVNIVRRVDLIQVNGIIRPRESVLTALRDLHTSTGSTDECAVIGAAALTSQAGGEVGVRPAAAWEAGETGDVDGLAGEAQIDASDVVVGSSHHSAGDVDSEGGRGTANVKTVRGGRAQGTGSATVAERQ